MNTADHYCLYGHLTSEHVQRRGRRECTVCTCRDFDWRPEIEEGVVKVGRVEPFSPWRPDVLEASLRHAGLAAEDVRLYFRLAKIHAPATALLRVIAEVAHRSKADTDAGRRGARHLATIRRAAELLACPKS